MDKVGQLLSAWFSCPQKRPIKSLNRDTRPILSFATSYDVYDFTDTPQQNADGKIILTLFFLHLMNENKHYRITNKINN